MNPFEVGQCDVSSCSSGVYRRSRTRAKCLVSLPELWTEFFCVLTFHAGRSIRRVFCG